MTDSRRNRYNTPPQVRRLSADDDFDRFDRNMSRAVKGFGIAWIIWALFCLAVVIGIIVVAVHFIAKYW